MKKIIKKLFPLFLSFLMLIMTASNALADNYSYQELNDWVSVGKDEIMKKVGDRENEISLESVAVITGTTGSWGGASTAYLRVNGEVAYCILPWSKLPSEVEAAFVDYSISSESSTELQRMAKAMYYASDENIAHFALSYIWMIEMGNSYGWSEWYSSGGSSLNEEAKETIMNFVNSLDDREPVKGTLHLSELYSQSGNVYQDVAYGSFTPEENDGWINIVKKSANPDITNDNECYSLEKALYGIYSDKDCRWKIGELSTDINGNSTGKIKAKADQIVYVKEIKAPKGYILDKSVHEIKTEANKTVTVYADDIPAMEPIGLVLKKIANDAIDETIEGAEYKMNYYASDSVKDEPKYSWTFATDKNGEIRFEESYKISGDALTKNANGAYAVPLGTIAIKETKAPKGYLLNDETKIIHITMDENGNVNADTAIWNVQTMSNDLGVISRENVIRGDLELKKTDEADEPMANVSFKITNKSTGESHVIVTDEKGFASTASKHVLHSKRTNEGTDSMCGVWFGEQSALEDENGALPYGTYIIEEIVNASIMSFVEIEPIEVEINEALAVVNLGNIQNKKIEIKTNAWSDSTKTKIVDIKSEEKITDEISYKNLTAGKTYTFKGKVIDKETEEVLSAGESQITVEKSDDICNVSFLLDTTKLKGKELVVYEEVYEGNIKRASHEEKNDAKQTLYVPDIKTFASADGSKEINVSKNTMLTDKVEYKNLIVGKEYVLRGELYDKSTGKPTGITSEEKFVPEAKDGYVNVSFEFDSTDYVEKSLVVFETLYIDEKELICHADINDEDQTILFKNNTITNSEMPDTGDGGSMTVYCTMLAFALLTVGIVIVTRVKNK